VVYEGLRSDNSKGHRVILTRFLAELERELVVVASTMDLLGWLRKHLGAADTDLLRELVVAFSWCWGQAPATDSVEHAVEAG